MWRWRWCVSPFTRLCQAVKRFSDIHDFREIRLKGVNALPLFSIFLGLLRLGIGESHVSPRREDYVFVTGGKTIAFTRVPWCWMTFEGETTAITSVQRASHQVHLQYRVTWLAGKNHKVRLQHSDRSRSVTRARIRCFFSLLWRNGPTRTKPALFLRSLDYTQWHRTVGRTPLDEGSARRRDFYLTTHYTHKRQTSIPPAGFEPATPATDRSQTHALDRSAVTHSVNFKLYLSGQLVRRSTFKLRGPSRQ